MTTCVPNIQALIPRRYREAPENPGETLADAANDISMALLTLTRQGGGGNFMIVGAGDDYVQFLGRRGDPQIECELASPFAGEAEGGHRGKLAWLVRSGFTLDEDQLTCKYTISGERAAWEVAQCTVLLLRSLYGFTPEMRVQIKLVLE